MSDIEFQTVYKITEEEKINIKKLFNRRNSLYELMNSAKENQTLYEKLNKDFSESNKLFHQWFIDFENKYNAIGTPDHFWDVDFDNNQVLLREEIKV